MKGVNLNLDDVFKYTVYFLITPKTFFSLALKVIAQHNLLFC